MAFLRRYYRSHHVRGYLPTVRSKGGTSYTRYLLRESFREDAEVHHRTIANLSSCSEKEAVHQLSSLCAISVSINGKPMYHQVPQPPEELKALIEAAGATIPIPFGNSGVVVSTRATLGHGRIPY